MSDTAVHNDRGISAERRVAERKSPLLRTAKVVCQSGEYVCLIRHISQDGLGLSYLHDTPPEARIILQTTNGLTYPIERAWEGRRQAAYRFASDIAIEEFLHEESPFATRPVRLNITAEARIADGQMFAKVQLIDISREGAKFESHGEHPRGRLISFDALGLPQRLAEVRWQDGQTFGIQFQHPLSINQLAEMALRLQPFAARIPDPVGRKQASARAA